MKRLDWFVRLYDQGVKSKDPLLVWVSMKSGRMICRSIYEKMKKLGKNSGIDKLHTHTCYGIHTWSGSTMSSTIWDLSRIRQDMPVIQQPRYMQRRTANLINNRSKLYMKNKSNPKTVLSWSDSSALKICRMVLRVYTSRQNLTEQPPRGIFRNSICM